MRTLLAAALLLLPVFAAAQDAPKPLAIELVPLGDDEHGVVAQVFFRFANPRQITEAGLFLEGAFTQAGHVPRNFRFEVPRKDDKFIWNNYTLRNGRTVRSTQWAVLPDQRNQMGMLHTFDLGAAEVEVRLILEGDRGAPPVVVAQSAQTITIAKTNQPFRNLDGDAPEEPAEIRGPVTIQFPRRNRESGLFRVEVNAAAPVKRVEFWLDDKRVFARNARPFTADLDLGDPNAHVAVRAIGYDAAGRYVDADAFVVNEDDTRTRVKITRTVTSDGVSHFKVSVRSAPGTRPKNVVLFAGDRKLHEWSRGPFAVSIPAAQLEGVESVRAVVVNDAGDEASDVQRFTKPRL